MFTVVAALRIVEVSEVSLVNDVFAFRRPVNRTTC